MSESWMRLSSNKYVDLDALTEVDVDIKDINTSLNHTIRFSGHHKDAKPLTVAQHTDLCLRIAERLFPEAWDIHLAVLIHDWPEAYYGDIATPFKKILGESYREIIRPIDEAVESKYWYKDTPITQEMHEAVKVCDLLSLDFERRSMWKSQYGKDKWPVTPDFMDMSVAVKRDYFNMSAEKDFVDMEEMYNELIAKLS